MAHVNLNGPCFCVRWDERVVLALLCTSPSRVDIAVFVFSPGQQQLLKDRVRVNAELSQRVIGLFGDRLQSLRDFESEVGAVECPPPLQVATREYNRLCFTEHLEACPPMTMRELFSRPLETPPETREIDGKTFYVMIHCTNGKRFFHRSKPGTFFTPDRESAHRYLFPQFCDSDEGISYEILVDPNDEIVDLTPIYGLLCNTYGAKNGSELVAAFKALGLLSVLPKFFHMNYQSFNEVVARDRQKIAAAFVCKRGKPGFTQVPLDCDALDDEERRKWDLLFELNKEFE